MTVSCRRRGRVLSAGEVHGKLWQAQRGRADGVGSLRSDGDRTLCSPGPRLRRLLGGRVVNTGRPLQRSTGAMWAQHHGPGTSQPQAVSNWRHLAPRGRLYVHPRQAAAPWIEWPVVSVTFVCVRLCVRALKEKKKTWDVNTKLGMRETGTSWSQRSKVKVTVLWRVLPAWVHIDMTA